MTIIVSAITLSVFADTFSLSKIEISQMQKEADNWIDEMPDGLQDRLSDAVNHAMRGFFSEIEEIRNIKDTIGLGKYEVDVKNLQGGLNSNVPMKIYKGKRTKNSIGLPVLIYFHGGGWSLGSIEVAERFCRALASEGNVVVIAMSYPKAPENPYPAALDYCVPAVEWIYGKVKEWGGDPMKVSLGGDGSGGNLALAVYEKLPMQFKIKSLAIFYPIINPEGELNVMNKRNFGRGYGFDSRLWESFITAYKGEDLDKRKKLPSILLISAGRDIIISDEKEFAEKNPSVKYIEFTEAIHGFITDGHQKTAFNKAVEFTDEFLTE